MDNVEEKKQRKARKRSPGYPMISLEEAIQRAKILWDEDKNNPIPLKAVYEHLGYKTEGGYGGRVLAAMKHFGLIYEKQNDILLTNEAIDLALHDPSDKIYIDTIKKLALNPAIYEKLFNEYNGILPSDATLRVKLIKEYDFNPNKVHGFLSDLRRTIEYARMNESRMEEDKPPSRESDMVTSDKTTIKESPLMPPPTLPKTEDKSQLLEIPILLSQSKLGKVYIPYPLTLSEWDLFESILNAYKPSLISSSGNLRGTPEKKDEQEQ